MKTSYISEMTWESFRDRVDDKAVALIPMGSMELEGHHLPLGVDTIVAEGIARRLAGETGLLIAPALPVGYSKWFEPFPGTLTLEMETLIKVLREMAAGLIGYGIRRILFLNAHRGNNAAIETASRSLVAEHDVRIALLSVWKMANDLTGASPGMIAEGKFTHAGEIMTSTVMALAPDTVQHEKIAPDNPRSPKASAFTVKNSLGEIEFRDSVQVLYQDLRDITTSGVMGDPTGANAKKGEAVLKLVTDYTRAFIQELRELPIPSCSTDLC